MIIVGDIGNTETKICIINSKNKIIRRIIIDTKKINSSLLKKSTSSLNIQNYLIKKFLICSVVPKAYDKIKIFFNKIYKIRCYELKNLNLKKLIKIKVNYKQIGSDRLANAISVSNYKDNFIILDFGTATTFDVLIKNTYHGGVIAPGVKLSLNTLIDKATQIPSINLKKTKKVIGLNTISAVRAGFFWGYKGLIDNIIKLIKKETKLSFKIIITGGFSNLFKNSIKTKVLLNKDITINGLIKATTLIK
ncbi:pantothenate kinase [Candidatus Pelagibacter ubique]|uniref:Type III pantothenate kinase n=1 Tax=Pelagibacter ubique TaxID=198252 RepID=A0ABX1T4D7_PELUQ|nr:type III pantothenate kinase [Candidatus Pelagibacter ubique]NMN68105.1 pantothenate kinase [Candidatus Pelagibacter ubique]